MNERVIFEIWFEGPIYSRTGSDDERMDLDSKNEIKIVLSQNKGEFNGNYREERENKKRFTVREFQLSSTSGGPENYSKYVQKKLTGYNVTTNFEKREIIIEKKYLFK